MDGNDGTRVTVTPLAGTNAADLRVCSPDGTGLGCDLARTIFDFGLVVERGDFSTDGKWSFLMFKVRPGNRLQRGCSWTLLKRRLEAVCPLDPSAAKLRAAAANKDAQRQPFIFQVEVTDRVGLLHDVTQTLWERELTVHRAHVSTSPSNQAVDLFYVTDMHSELPSSERFQDVQDYVRSKLGDVSAKFSLFPALPNPECRCGATIPCDGTICGGPGASSFGEPPAGRPAADGNAADPLDELEELGDAQTSGYAETTVTVDNYTSKAHTVLQVRTRDRKGLLYDSLRAIKDLKINVSYGKVEVRETGICEMDLFVGRNSNEEVERRLCQRLKRAIERPLEVALSSKGDGVTTELCVTAPMDAAGFARPRVLLDVTDALRSLGVMVFKADIHSARRPGKALQEVHRFLLTDLVGQPIVSAALRSNLVKMVRASLLD